MKKIKPKNWEEEFEIKRKERIKKLKKHKLSATAIYGRMSSGETYFELNEELISLNVEPDDIISIFGSESVVIVIYKLRKGVKRGTVGT